MSTTSVGCGGGSEEQQKCESTALIDIRFYEATLIYDTFFVFYQLVNNDKEQTDFTSLQKVKPNKTCWGQEFQNMQKKR